MLQLPPDSHCATAAQSWSVGAGWGVGAGEGAGDDVVDRGADVTGVRTSPRGRGVHLTRALAVQLGHRAVPGRPLLQRLPLRGVGADLLRARLQR